MQICSCSFGYLEQVSGLVFVIIGFCGLLVMLFLEMRKVKGALLIGIIFSTALAAIFGYIERPAEIISFHLDIKALAFR